MLNQVVTDPAWMFYEIHELSMRQSVTPQRLLGRVNATFRFSGFGANLAGIGAAAAIGELSSARAALFTAVACMFVSALFLLLSPVARLISPMAAK